MVEILTFRALFAELQGEHEQFIEGVLLDEQGAILDQTEDSVLGPNETYPLLVDWATHQKSIMYGGVKYSLLKSEPENLSTYNVNLKEGVVGSITRTKVLAVARVKTEDFVELGNSAILLGQKMWEL
ncbi:MAG TPA: hypothetical protein VKK79_21670 [Candidatus Lokiarchaeia archaeon]|nr:hypothetical protein [Candidatus Lokiarchaeia archaeon]